MKSEVFWLILPILFILSCRTPQAPAPEAAPTLAGHTAAPAAAQAAQVPTAQPLATQTPVPTPSPSPTPTPVPTPTPDPYAGQERVSYEKDERFFYVTLTDELKERITGMSYPAPGEPCRISYEELRYVRILYVDFAGQEQEGELMVNRLVADDVLDIFYELYVQGYPLASVRLVDDFGQPGDDGNSMRANNTSAFCYRQVTGSKKLSWHSFGAAVDINPVQNPYINGTRVSPDSAREYLNRKDKRPGMIDHSDLCYKLFHAHGWVWGGDFKGDRDYQHFYKDIGYQR